MQNSNRIKSALLFLKDEQSFKVDNLTLDCKANIFKVIGWSEYIIFENITRQIAEEELLATKEKFAELLQGSIELASFAEGKEIEYYLNYSDSGKGGIQLSKEVKGIMSFSSSIT